MPSIVMRKFGRVWFQGVAFIFPVDTPAGCGFVKIRQESKVLRVPGRAV